MKNGSQVESVCVCVCVCVCVLPYGVMVSRFPSRYLSFDISVSLKEFIFIDLFYKTQKGYA